MTGALLADEIALVVRGFDKFIHRLALLVRMAQASGKTVVLDVIS
jgi:hypothetical protein